MSMIAAEEFVALLEAKDLLSPELLTHLRRQISRPDHPVSAALLAKWLVDRGHLSRILAQRLLTRAEETAQATADPGDAQFDWEKAAEAEEDELGLAPLDDEITSTPGAGKRRRTPAKKPPDPPPPPQPRAPSQAPRQKPTSPAAPAGGSILDEEVPLPLGGLAGDPALAATDSEPGPLTLPGSKKKGLFGRKKRGPRGRRENIWDSPLLLLGGGLLLFLVIALGILYWAVTRRTGDETFAAAEEFYRNGAYTKAIDQYTDFLEDFPGHDSVSLARVKRGLARLRQATDRTSDWPGALEEAKEVLGEIAQEEDFHTEARPELIAMLPKIADGLANKARAELDSALVIKAQEGLALVNKYITAKSRPVTKLADIEAVLALTRREIDRDAQLETTIASMNKAVEEERPIEGYTLRAALLKQYPSLTSNERLRESVLAVSEAMLSVVKSVEKQQPAEAAEPPVATLATVALARRTTNSAPPGTEGHVIFVLAPGAAYGLDAADGKILWRRPVGFSTNGRTPGFPPTPIAEKPGSDAIMVDAARNEVLRIESATGSPRWRHSLGEKFDAHPVVADKELLVATRSGRLARINLDEGGSAAYVQFPQELRVGPTVDFRRSNIYQVAEHSNLFVVSLADGKPKQIVYLGHLPGSITVSPVLVNRYLIVAENDGVEHSTLRVLALDAEEEGEPPVRVLQSVRLEGHVDSPPQVSGVRMLVATDQGELYVFEISGTDAEKPLVPVAQSTASSEEKLADEASPEGLIRFPLLKGSRVWIADSQLTWYDVQPSQGRLQPRGIKNERSATTQPLLAIGQTVFHVRRDVGLPGIQVSAIAPEQGDPLWEIHLAAPLVSEPMIDAASGQITAVNSIGAIFHVDSAGLEGDAAIDQPVVALKPAEIRGPVTDVIRVKDRLLVMAFGSGTKQLPAFDPAEGARFRWLSLPHPLGGHPLAFGDGLLAPTEVGQAFLLNVRSGKRQIEPFQPPLTSGEQVVWSRPALAGPEAMLLAESHTGLYRIGVKEEPKPHLASLAEVDLAEPIVSPLAVLENVVYALDAADSLLAFELPGLTPSPPRPLGAKSVWGPGRVGDHVLLATDDDQLYCLDSAQKTVWQVALPYGRLAGAPLLVDSQYVLAAANGVIWRVESATGKEVGSVETGYPLGTGPVRLGDVLLVGGHDGSLYKVKMP